MSTNDKSPASAETVPHPQSPRPPGAVEATKILGPATATEVDGAQASDESSLEPTQDDSLPERVGPYFVEGRLGRGGMGEVLAVRDYRFDRLLALKRLHPFPSSPAKAALFVSEMKVTASLDHPNVVPVIDRGTDEDGRPYFLMPLLRGDRLQDLIVSRGGDRGGLTELLDRLVKVASAVSHAHQRGVLHLDLKPANILCGEEESVYVLDWGIARLMSSGDEARPGLGTPRFMAPEQIAPSLGEVSERTDVYGLGALLYSIAFREAPPPVFEESILEHPTKSDAPPRLREIIARAMARLPEDRHPSAQAFADDIRGFFTVAPFVMVVYRDVKKGREADYDAWAKDMAATASRAPGHQSITIIALPSSDKDETVRYLMISRFASLEHATAFDASDERRVLMDRAADEAFSAAAGRLDVRGRHAWISLDGT